PRGVREVGGWPAPDRCEARIVCGTGIELVHAAGGGEPRGVESRRRDAGRDASHAARSSCRGQPARSRSSDVEVESFDAARAHHRHRRARHLSCGPDPALETLAYVGAAFWRPVAMTMSNYVRSLE